MQLFATPWTVSCQFLCPWDSPGKNTGVGFHFILQGKYTLEGIGGTICWIFMRYKRMREAKNNILFCPMHLKTWNWHLLTWRRIREIIGNLVLDILSLRCQLDIYVEMQAVAYESRIQERTLVRGTKFIDVNSIMRLNKSPKIKCR